MLHGGDIDKIAMIDKNGGKFAEIGT